MYRVVLCRAEADVFCSSLGLRHLLLLLLLQQVEGRRARTGGLGPCRVV